MFGLMKTPVKDNPPPSDAMTFSDLHADCVVGFGFMPQKSLSGRRITVNEVNSYLFDEDNFIAYRLDVETFDVNLIVADEADPAGTYLALSQRIDSHLLSLIFPNTLPEKWFLLEEGDAVEARPVVLGMAPGWLTSSYTVAVKTKGQFLEGDYRMRKPVDRSRLARPFEYVLLVDEDNEYGLEVEKYEDGTMNVYATVYRPASDIGEMTRAPKSLASVEIIPHIAPADIPRKSEIEEASSSAQTLEIAKPTESVEPVFTVVQKTAEEPAAEKVTTLEESVAVGISEPVLKAYEQEKKEQEVVSDKSDVKQDSIILFNTGKAEDVKESASTVMADDSLSATPQAAEITLVHSKFGRIQPNTAQSAVPETLACDLKLASRLIDEAQRNQMLLSELVRKVIDLPARVREEVLIPFALESAEQAELARRYNLPASDTEGVKRHILEELRRFVGEKK